MSRRGGPAEVNAGSMADIAFLLLIFFLVTTTIETDAGLDRMLPPMEPPTEDPPIIKEKNIFTVNINRNGQLLVEDELTDIKALRVKAMAFNCFLSIFALFKAWCTTGTIFCWCAREASSGTTPPYSSCIFCVAVMLLSTFLFFKTAAEVSSQEDSMARI